MKIKKINLNKINCYLDSRNLSFNRDKMLNSKKISNLDHYTWWFKNKREIYFCETKKNKIIFFWQQKMIFKDYCFYIGGWHSNYKNTNLYDVLYALKWLLKKNKIKKKNYDWLAIVKRGNSSILTFTKYMGYNEIFNSNDYFYKLIKKTFKIDNNKYHFLKHTMNK